MIGKDDLWVFLLEWIEETSDGFAESELSVLAASVRKGVATAFDEIQNGTLMSGQLRKVSRFAATFSPELILTNRSTSPQSEQRVHRILLRCFV